MRACYTPQHPQLIFVLESPPKSGLYFYDPTGRVSEPLFSAMMTDVLGIKPATKNDGLKAFAARGCLLVDATYSPVNHDHLSPRERNALILQDFPLLEADLPEYARPDTRLVIVKANVCDLLEARLTGAGFTVLNKGRRIPFPSTGQQGKFRVLITEVLSGVVFSPENS
jgi:hypothetical protein